MKYGFLKRWDFKPDLKWERERMTILEVLGNWVSETGSRVTKGPWDHSRQAGGYVSYRAEEERSMWGSVDVKEFRKISGGCKLVKFLKGEEQDCLGNSLMGESVKLLENQSDMVNQRVLERMQAADFDPVLAYEELYEQEQGGMRDVNRA